MLFQWDLNKEEQHKNFIELSEMQFNKRIMAVVSNISNIEGVKVITIAGPTSSGKTTTASKISELLYKEDEIKSKIISLDDFYKDKKEVPKREDGSYDFEVIEAIDVELVLKCLNELIEKNETLIPKFDFKRGARREEYDPMKIEKDELVIIEGLHGLNPAIIDNLPKGKFKSVYITIAEKIYMPGNIVISKRDVRLMRRLIRDYKHRNATPELTFQLWEIVCESENVTIFPFEHNADYYISSLHDYEVCVVKHQVEELLEKIGRGSKYYTKAVELIEKLALVPSIEEGLVPEDSLLREFI